jgi:hypothetical protein
MLTKSEVANRLLDRVVALRDRQSAAQGASLAAT